ncbi:MAG: hypothetical protein MUP64_10455 [Anaerolineae bacterium]|nr:hypothetical protein [Anaerolineae bacterium]
MIINNNFFSMIVLGNFNPSILNRNFLISKNFNFGDEKFLDEKYAPIFSIINFEKIKILMDLDRFQVIEEKLDNFENNRVISFVNEYFNILEYTPLRVAGINFNVDVKIDILKIMKFIKTKKLFDMFRIKNIVLNIEKNINENKLDEILNIKLKAVFDNKHTIQMGINKKNNDIYNVNYNYEIICLEKKPEEIKYFKDNFNSIYEDYKNNLKTLFGD